MNGLFRNSTLSFASSTQVQSVVSDPTTNSSDDTVRGLGSLGGKVIYAFGEATLRGLENLAIRRKLRTINHIFPHDDSATIKNVKGLYDDVLELSRPGLYRTQIRKQAMKVLLIQIAARQTHHLTLSLIKWPAVELSLFIAETMACMPPDWLPPDTEPKEMQRELMSIYLNYQIGIGTSREYHPASPIIDFIVKVAQINHSACQAVLDAGFLDMLLCMYVCNFGFSTSSRHFSVGIDGKSMMIEACSDALLQLSENPGAAAVIVAHPVLSLWPKNRPLTLLLKAKVTDRSTVWRTLGPLVIARRLASMSSIMEMQPVDEEFPVPAMEEACKDLVEFGRHAIYGHDIAGDAFKWIRKFVELRGPYWTALSDALNGVADSNDIFKRLIPPSLSMEILDQYGLGQVVDFVPSSTLNTASHHRNPSLDLFIGNSSPLHELPIPSKKSSLPPTPLYPINTQGVDIIRATIPLPATPTELSINPRNSKANMPESRQRMFQMTRDVRAGRWAIDTYEYDTKCACLPGTRESIISRIMSWVQDTDRNCPRVLWLQGMVGEGKSAIASTIANRLFGTSHYLGASVFFTREDSRRSDITSLISTISVHLARRNDIINRAVCDVMNRYWGSSHLFDEFTMLLKGPLEAAARSSSVLLPVVIVLDGMDGLLIDKSSIYATLRQLISLPHFVKILFTSRPEPEFGDVFRSAGSQVETLSLSDVPREITDHDISAFVESGLAAIASGDEGLREDGWPGKSKRMALVKKSAGVFLWASKAVHYIRTDDQGPEQSLDDLLSQSLEDPFSECSHLLDRTYIDALESAYLTTSFATNHLLCHQIVGAISISKRALSPETCSAFLWDISHTSQYTAEQIFGLASTLCSLITFTSSDQNSNQQRGMRLIHPSFSQFLESDRCPARFAIDKPIHHHAEMAAGCLLRMQQCLRRNICDIQDPTQPNEKVENMDLKIAGHIPDDLRYACRFWADHLCESPSDQEDLYRLVRSFLGEHLRNWIEVLSILGLMDGAVTWLRKVWDWLDLDIDHDDLLDLVPEVCNAMLDSHSQLVETAGYSHVFFISFHPLISHPYFSSIQATTGDLGIPSTPLHQNEILHRYKSGPVRMRDNWNEEMTGQDQEDMHSDTSSSQSLDRPLFKAISNNQSLAHAAQKREFNISFASPESKLELQLLWRKQKARNEAFRVLCSSVDEEPYYSTASSDSSS